MAENNVKGYCPFSTQRAKPKTCMGSLCQLWVSKYEDYRDRKIDNGNCVFLVNVKNDS